MMPGRNANRRSGTALAELAVSLTLLLAIVLGCIDAGRFAYSYVSISSATKEAAFFASRHGFGEFGGLANWVAEVKQRAIDEAPTLVPAIKPEDIDVDTDILEDGFVNVSVAYTFQPLVPWPYLPEQWPMNRRVVMSHAPP